MSFKKHVITSLLVGGLISPTTIPVFAEEDSVTVNETERSQLMESIDLNDTSSDTVVSEVLTFNQVVEQIADDQEISEAQAAKQVIAGTQVSSLKKPPVSSITKGLVDTTASSQAVAAASATYRTINTAFTVTKTYKPSLNFYCQTNEGGTSFRSIKKILNVSMNRSHLGSGRSKSFDGTVYTKLEDPNRIYWIVNGDFLDNGTTTGGGAVNIGIDKAASIEFNASRTTNHYKYLYKTGYTRF